MTALTELNQLRMDKIILDNDNKIKSEKINELLNEKAKISIDFSNLNNQFSLGCSQFNELMSQKNL